MLENTDNIFPTDIFLKILVISINLHFITDLTEQVIDLNALKEDVEM